jgi:cytochrome c oxidase cbb3-type subunit III
MLLLTGAESRGLRGCRPAPSSLKLRLRISARFFSTASIACAICFILCARCPAQAPSAGSITGARRYTQFCAGCHGADGKGGDKAASLATSQSVISRSDAELFRMVRDGTAQGMPPFAQIGEANIAAVVRYLRILEQNAVPTPASATAAPPGDANAGRALFFGKAGCSACHMVHGEGGFIAPNLTTYARNRSAQAILDVILTPDSPLVSTSRVATVTTIAGQRITGVLRNEDAFNLALQTEDGRYHFFSRNDLTAVTYSDHSLMPLDYGTRLTASELSDIAGFLIASSREPRSGDLQSGGPRTDAEQNQ